MTGDSVHCEQCLCPMLEIQRMSQEHGKVHAGVKFESYKGVISAMGVVRFVYSLHGERKEAE